MQVSGDRPGLMGLHLRVGRYCNSRMTVSRNDSVVSWKGNETVGSYTRDRPDSSNMVIASSSSKSAPSSAPTEIISIGGLPLSDLDGTGMSTAAPFAVTAPCSSTPPSAGGVVAGGGVADVGEGEGADEGIASSGCDGVRTFIVTRLERGPEAGSRSDCCWGSGVEGMVGSESIFMAESPPSSGGGVRSWGELGE